MINFSKFYQARVKTKKFMEGVRNPPPPALRDVRQKKLGLDRVK